MNKIWTSIIMISLFYGIVTGRINEMVDSLFGVPKESLNMTIIIASSLIIWNGLFCILKESNIIRVLSRPLRFITKRIFKNVDEDTIDIISLNMIANIFGLGAAATPIGIEAIKRLNQNNNKNKNMLTLLLVNIGTLSIMPFSILSIRSQYDSKLNFIVWISIIIMTLIIFIIGIIIAINYKDKENDV